MVMVVAAAAAAGRRRWWCVVGGLFFLPRRGHLATEPAIRILIFVFTGGRSSNSRVKLLPAGASITEVEVSGLGQLPAQDRATQAPTLGR